MTTALPLQTDSPDAAVVAVPGEILLSIAAVERETGLGKDTLRAWERRYGFPLPLRDAAGVRGYPRAMVERLRLIRRALLNGQRPGRLFALPPHELEAVLASIAGLPAHPSTRAVGLETRSRAGIAGSAPASMLALDDCLAALRTGGADAVRHWLTRGLARAGLGSFVVEGLAPLTVALGNAWLGGSVAVYEEHVVSEAIQSVLRGALLPFQTGLEASTPRVLLTTVPGEEHGLGLLMAEALMTLEACRCLSLGVQTPIDDIVAACRAHRIDVVALSFSESLPGPQAMAALHALRERLPAGVAIWAGGGSPALRASRLSGIQVMQRLVDIVRAVALWRDESNAAVD
jgi:methanogenic corrinoid protein MtbC1